MSSLWTKLVLTRGDTVWDLTDRYTYLMSIGHVQVLTTLDSRLPKRAKGDQSFWSWTLALVSPCCSAKDFEETEWADDYYEACPECHTRQRLDVANLEYSPTILQEPAIDFLEEWAGLAGLNPLEATVLANDAYCEAMDLFREALAGTLGERPGDELYFSRK